MAGWMLRLFIIVTSIAMNACTQGPQQPQSQQADAKQQEADARLRSIYTTEWKWREEQFADNEDSQKPIADHLPRVDPAAQQVRLKYWEDLLSKLDTIPREQLSPQEQINYDIYRPQIQVLIANQRFRD